MQKVGNRIIYKKREQELEPELSGTAIVIDDDHSTVELLSEFLEMKGIKVIGKSHNGKEAAEIYEKLRPDFVFLDIMMPQFDGFYALEKIRNINPDAKIMMITANLTKETADKLDELKVPYLYKPYEFEEIVRVIKKFS
jgi:two-component system, chemotaxis family, chemotaxis protein CheY